jgi:uncharacterized membrane protein YczE
LGEVENGSRDDVRKHLTAFYLNLFYRQSTTFMCFLFKVHKIDEYWRRLVCQSIGTIILKNYSMDFQLFCELILGPISHITSLLYEAQIELYNLFINTVSLLTKMVRLRAYIIIG